MCTTWSQTVEALEESGYFNVSTNYPNATIKEVCLKSCTCLLENTHRFIWIDAELMHESGYVSVCKDLENFININAYPNITNITTTNNNIIFMVRNNITTTTHSFTRHFESWQASLYSLANAVSYVVNNEKSTYKVYYFEEYNDAILMLAPLPSSVIIDSNSTNSIFGYSMFSVST